MCFMVTGRPTASWLLFPTGTCGALSHCMVSATCEREILTIVVVYTASAEVGFNKGFRHAHILSSNEL